MRSTAAGMTKMAAIRSEVVPNTLQFGDKEPVEQPLGSFHVLPGFDLCCGHLSLMVSDESLQHENPGEGQQAAAPIARVRRLWITAC